MLIRAVELLAIMAFALLLSLPFDGGSAILEGPVALIWMVAGMLWAWTE